MTYVQFIRQQPRFLAFGFLLTMSSSFGQTFFIALFGADIRATFALSHGGFGTIYSVATLTSGLLLIWLGRLLDHVDLRLYSVLVCAGMIGAAFLMALGPSAGVLLIALLALRLTGQGLLSHTAATSMARYFTAGRGKALSIASLGFPVGEAMLPLVMVVLIATLGWRQTWGAVGIMLAVVLVPLVLWLLRGHGERHRRLLAETVPEAAMAAGAAIRQWTRAEVLRDRRFYVILAALLAPSFITTGLFFHQVHIAESKGWSMAWLAGSFVAHAAAAVPASLWAGHLIDRLGALRLLPASLLPLAGGLLVLTVFDHPLAAPVYLAAAGFGQGVVATIMGAIWAELYGVRHLGAIRALVTALSVVASALAPATMGWLIDRGSAVETISVACLAYVLAATVMLLAAFGARQRFAAWQLAPAQNR